MERVVSTHTLCESFELFKVRIGLETTEIRRNETQIATQVRGDKVLWMCGAHPRPEGAAGTRAVARRRPTTGAIEQFGRWAFESG